MIRHLLIILLLLVFTCNANAQQRPQFSQYMLNNFLINPAIAGIEDYADIRVSNRRQWQGLDGAPVTYYLTAHTPLNKGASGNRYHKGLAHHGLGVSFHTDKTGPLRRTSLLGTYAYHMPITRTINTAVGASAGIIRNTINAGELRLTNPNDPLLGSNNTSNSVLDLNLGILLYTQNFSIGVAGAQLLENAGSFEPEGSRNASMDLQRHYFISGAYRFSPTPDLDIVPSALLKLASPSPASIDASLRVLYKKQFWVGGGYRHDDAVIAMVGVNVSPLLDVSYSYDATLSNLNRVSSGTHEVVVGFKLLNTRRVICPQWIW